MRRALMIGRRALRPAISALLLAATIAAPDAHAAALRQFALAHGSAPLAIAAGPEGNMWFTDDGCAGHHGVCAIGRITPAGAITEFTVGLPRNSVPGAIALGPDGNLWFTDESCKGGFGTCAIGRITPGGEISEFSTGLGAGDVPSSITPGPDGGLWFTQFASAPESGAPAPGIGRITPSGVITQFAAGLGQTNDITAGPDGNLWFTSIAPAIGRITTSGVMTLFRTGLDPNSWPESIVAAADGQLWFTDGGCVFHDGPCGIGHITTGGSIAEGSRGLHGTTLPAGLARAADGNLWFADQHCEVGRGPCAIGRVTERLAITEFETGLPRDVRPGDFATGPRDTIWFTNSGRRPAIDRLAVLRAPVIKHVSQRVRRWAESGRSARLSATRPPIGTTFRFMLDGAAKMTLTFAPADDTRRQPESLTLIGHRGVNVLHFYGRLTPRTRLRPGRYMLSIAARAFGQSSRRHRLRFTILSG